MNNFVIDPKKISPADILAELNEFIASKPDADTWKDFFAGSAGTIVKELISGMGSFLAYQTVVARREAFLRYAQNRSSIIGHAQSKGYSIYRGLNPRVSVTMVPTQTMTLDKFAVIGSVKDTDLVLLETTALVAGTEVTLNCTWGAVGTEVINYAGGTGKPMYLRFKQPKVSEDIELTVNDVVVVTSKRLIDAETGKYVLQSNPVGSADMFFLNDPRYPQIATGNQLKIQYVQYNPISAAASDVSVDYDGVSLVQITQAIINPETNAAISINAPLYAETQYVVRARQDYPKILKLLNPSIIDSGFKNISPMVVALFYLKDDLTLLTEDEKANLLTELIVNRNMGLEPPQFSEATRNPVSVICTVKYTSLEVGLDTSIAAICKAYEKKMNTTLDFDAIENSIEDLDGVKIARIEMGTTLWTALAKAQVGQYFRIDNSDVVFRVDRLIYTSGSTEPAWPTVVGDQVTDGKLIWECKYLERQCDPTNPIMPIIPPRGIWMPDTDYQLNQIVIPSTLDIYEYKVVGVINNSGANEPTWTPLAGQTPEELKGQTVTDGNLLWQACPVLGTPATWFPGTNYNKGDAVIANDLAASDTIGVMFQCVGFLGTTGVTSTSLTGHQVGEAAENGTIKWLTVDKTITPDKLRADEFYLITPQVTLISGAQ